MASPPNAAPGEFTLPDALPVLPLPDGVVFPLTAVPLLVVNPAAIRVIDDVMRGNRLLVFAAQREPKPDAPVTPENVWSNVFAGCEPRPQPAAKTTFSIPPGYATSRYRSAKKAPGTIAARCGGRVAAT